MVQQYVMTVEDKPENDVPTHQKGDTIFLLAYTASIHEYVKQQPQYLPERQPCDPLFAPPPQVVYVADLVDQLHDIHL
jgi:hypothetical protein